MNQIAKALTNLQREDDPDGLKIQALCFVLGMREAELLELKGPCSNFTCSLHYAHRGPCHVR